MKTLKNWLFAILMVLAVAVIALFVGCNTPEKLQRKEELADTKAVNRVLGSKPNLDRVTPAVLALNPSNCDSTDPVVLKIDTSKPKPIDTAALIAKIIAGQDSINAVNLKKAFELGLQIGSENCPEITKTTEKTKFDRTREKMALDSLNECKRLLAHERGKTQLSASIIDQLKAKGIQDTKESVKPWRITVLILSGIIAVLLGGWLFGGKVRGLVSSIKNLIPGK